MAVFSRQIATAKRLVKKYGAQCSWFQSVEVKDEDRPWDNGTEEHTYEDIYICFVGNSDSELSRLVAALTGGDISYSKGQALMAAVNFKPANGDKITRKSDGQVFVVKDFNELNPNGESILYTLRFV